MPDEYMPAPTRLILDGRPWWKFLDGTLLPVVAGGDGAGDGDDGEGGGDDAGDGGDPSDLGEAGKRALDAERSRAKAAEKARKAAEKELGDARKRLADIDASSKSETEKAIEKAKAEATTEATKEATAKANAHILRAEIKAAAAGKLARPEYALKLLDLDDFEVDDDGEVDADAIAKAIDQLVKDDPALAAGKARGSADGGARSDSGDSNQALSPHERLRRAYSTSK